MVISYTIIPNTTKKWAISLAREVDIFLTNEGYKKSKNPEITIIIGGDGSFYYNLNKVKGKVLLIGSETTYRSQISKYNWKLKLLSFIKRNKTINLPLLSVYKNGKLIGEGVNDIVFHSKDYKVSDFSIFSKNRIMNYRGDGLIISTPFGSTAYSYSAGGSKLNLNSKKIIITPICPYLRVVKPTIFSDTEEIEIECPGGNALLMIDGIIKNRKCKGRYTILKSKQKIQFMK